MGKSKDLTNKKFGRLTAIKKVGVDKETRSNMWLCKCDCGNFIESQARYLCNGHKKSCGCLKRDICKEMIEKIRPTSEQIKMINKKYNKYDLNGKYGIGYTNNGDEFYFDLEDYDKIKDYCWNKGTDGYIICGHPQTSLHSLVFQREENKIIDHINGNPSDNRKENLRNVTPQQNCMNTKTRKDNNLGVKGITKRYNKYIARIKFNGKSIHLGSFSNIEDAIKARKNAEIKYFKEYSSYLSRNQKS